MAETTNNTNTPNALSGLFFFFIITCIYFAIKLSSKSPQTIKIWTFIYFLTVVVGEYFINLTATDQMCGSAQYTTAFYVTVVPWVIIFGLLNLMLVMLPGWLVPFSNTFGYLGAKLTNVDALFKEMLVPEFKGNTVDDKLGNEALAYIRTDPTLLINRITESNFDNFWSEMKTSGQFFKPNIEQYKEKLRQYVNLKDNISLFIWYILTGGLVTSVSYNYIVNAGCKQSATEMENRHKDYVQKQQQIVEEKATEEPRVYNISD
jgi:hypothetical protein